MNPSTFEKVQAVLVLWERPLWWASLYSRALTTICVDEVPAPRSGSRQTSVQPDHRQARVQAAGAVGGTGGGYKPRQISHTSKIWGTGVQRLRAPIATPPPARSRQQFLERVGDRV